MGAEIAEHDGVAVRCRTHHASGCDAAGGAGDVLDDDRLPERPRMRSARIRANTSAGPAAGNGTTMVIGRDG